MRVVLQNETEASGTVSVTWDRRNSRDWHIKAGKHAVAVEAAGSTGQPASAGAAFAVS